MDVDQNLREELLQLLQPQAVCVAAPVVLTRPGPSCERLVVLGPWRGYLVTSTQPVEVENSFSYLEICSISVHGHSQMVLETDRLSLSFSVLHSRDLEDMVSHMTTSLKKIFPDSSPGKLLTSAPPHLQQRVQMATARSPRPGRCGGFSESYAALCDLNQAPLREEIQRDVDNIYCKHGWRSFNLLHFSHLDSRDVALAISALSFNQWFTKIYSKELRLSAEIQQQLMFLMSRSPALQQLSLENSGLKVDFAINMAAALRGNVSSVLQSINLSGNALEDKGVAALSQELKDLNRGLKELFLSRVQMTARGVGSLGQAFSCSPLLSASLTHLDLSENPGSLGTEDATFLFKFLSSTNCLSHLDLRDTSCPLDTLFVSLSAGCHNLLHLNLSRNTFSHRKVREVTRSVEEFFSRSCRLKYVCLSATKLPPQALRLLLQGLALNPRLTGLELDLSSCELRSAGAMVIQEHISEAEAIASLNISDNRLENDMVTLVLSFARCKTLKHLKLGRNFTMKSRALRDVLHRIAQLLQDDDCPLQSLSVCDSRLKAGTHTLLGALGGHVALEELDISGNHIGDVGAKMLAKALMTNSRLRTLHWDRNDVTARGYQDVADALERNVVLQQVPLPLADIAQSYRGNPEGTRDALLKIQMFLDRNKEKSSEDVEQQLETVQAAKHSATVWRSPEQAGSVRAASSLNSLLDAGWQKQTGGRPRGEAGATKEAAEGRRSLPLLLMATTLSFKTPSPSPSWSPSPPGQRGRRRKEGEAVDAAEALSVGRGASLSPPPTLPLLLSIAALKEEAAGRRRSTRPEAPSAGRRSGPGAPASPMEPLPTQGQTLRHYTASRPRPRRKHRQPPSSRTQESESKVENEASEAMGRVDEGVEEFFTKRIIPGYTLKGRWEESNPAQATPSESSSTPSVSTPFSSSSDIITPSITASVDSPTLPSTAIPPPSTEVPPVCTPPTPPLVAPTTTNPPKNIKKKFGDFFVFKRARAGRAAKAGGGEGGRGGGGGGGAGAGGGGGAGGGEDVKVKRTSIADLIRPLREAKERERERERGKEREKERGARSDANVSNDAAVTEGTIATALHLAGDVREKMAPTMTPLSDATPSHPTATTSPERPAAPPSSLLEDGGPSPHLGVVTPQPQLDMQFVKSPYGERKLKVSRTLREGKSQSLILLTGLEPEDKDGTPSKKHASESGSSFEQRLQVMLHRMGVAKTPPADPKMSQDNEEELRKANSEGAILDKPAAPPTSMKPRTMSTSSADPRHPLRALDPIRPDPVLYPKPGLAERPVGPLPPKPAIPSRLPVPIIAPPTGEATPPPSAPPSSALAERVRLGPHGGRSGEAAVQNCSHERPQGAPPTLPPHREGFPPASPWRSPNTEDRTGKAQSVTDESLPRTRLQVKPPQQRRAVSVHEDTLAMTQELKAVLQKSPIRLRGPRGETPSCLGRQSICEETQRAQASDGGRLTDGEQDGVPVEGGGTRASPAGQETSQSVPRPVAPAGQETSQSVPRPVAPAGQETSQSVPRPVAPAGQETSQSVPRPVAPAGQETSQSVPRPVAPAGQETSQSVPRTVAPAGQETSQSVPRPVAPAGQETSQSVPRPVAPAGQETSQSVPRPVAPAGQETSQSVPRPVAPAAMDTGPAQSHVLEKSPVSPVSHKQRPSTAPAVPQTLGNPQVSPPSLTKTPSTSPAGPQSSEVLQVKPPSHKKSNPGEVDLRTSTQQGAVTSSTQNPATAEPALQRPEPLLSD